MVIPMGLAAVYFDFLFDSFSEKFESNLLFPVYNNIDSFSKLLSPKITSDEGLQRVDLQPDGSVSQLDINISAMC